MNNPMETTMATSTETASGKRGLATDWMVGGVGAFMHYLPKTREELAAAAAQFDVEGVARQLVGMGADWFCLTLGQNDGFYISPNDVYETLAGCPAGGHCSARDIPAEFIRALRPHGIRLMLYLPCQTPNRDLEAIAHFGFGEDVRRGDRRLTPEGVGKWAEVIEEWSRRYGGGVSGWWFDGAYDFLGFSADVARIYSQAAKSGNPDAVVAFNSGLDCRTLPGASDYAAGEVAEPLDLPPCTSRFASGEMQWHVLTYMGDYWMKTNLRHTDEQWRAWLSSVRSHGGAVTLDMGHAFPSGLFDSAQAAQFRRVAK